MKAQAINAIKTTGAVLLVIYALRQISVTKNLVDRALQG
jgi:hypothetical protein